MPAVSLTQTLTQKTQLSLQMRQSVELLQLSGPELQNEIDARLLANPLLKADDEGGFAFESASAAEEAPAPQKSREPVRDAGVARDFREPNYLTWRGTLSDKEDFDPYGTLSSEESLCEHLLGQLGCLHLSADERQRCEWIIGNLDERGFLPEPLEDIARGFEQEAGRSSDMTAWRTALRLVRSFDPAGVAASGPTEALLLQLDRTQCEKSVRKAAEELLRQMPEALAKRDYKGAAKALGCPPEVIEQAHALVLSLNPPRFSPTPAKRAASSPKCFLSKKPTAGRPFSIRPSSRIFALTKKLFRCSRRQNFKAKTLPSGASAPATPRVSCARLKCATRPSPPSRRQSPTCRPTFSRSAPRL